MCPNCDKPHKLVPPDGPEDASIAFLGEAPGVDEDKRGQNFIGKTGRELNEHYLPLAGLRRSAVRVLNTVPFLPCTPKHKLDPSRPKHRDLINYGASLHLLPELERNHYSLLVPMGAVACGVIDPSINLELQHGIPCQTPFGKAYPMYHPAGGIHMPKAMLHIRTDWARLRKYLTGNYTLPVDAYPNPDYQECEDPRQLDHYIQSQGWDFADLTMACDTETTRSHTPYCLTFSVKPGTGRLIRATNLATLQHFNNYLEVWQGHILFHNWLFDGEVVEAMGLNFPWRRIVDTMVKVFELGNLPQGLKALAYRELGMVMQDFDDLVTPYSRELVLNYYRQAYHEEWGTPAEELVREAGGRWKLYKPQGFRTKLKRFWTDYSRNQDKDVFSMWTTAWEDAHEAVEKKLGPWPGKCVSHVPFEKVLYYAIRDADATLRIWPVIQHMERRVRKSVQERWRDAA